MKVTTAGVSLHVQDEGRGPAVLLLHGFPDSGALWRHQVPELVAAGYRVIAPDLRGFGASDRPADPAAYALPIIVGDVLGVLDACGVDRATVVGHDWGAAIAWALAAGVPERVDRLVALSVGHPAAFFTAPVEQRRRSWYMLFFQFVGMAEEALRAEDWRLYRTLFPSPYVDRQIADLDRPGALTAALNWYRANVPAAVFGSARRAPLPPVTVPALGIWSDGDDYLTEQQMTASADHVLAEWRYERIHGAGHWIPLDAPDAVTRLLVTTLAGVPPPGTA